MESQSYAALRGSRTCWQTLPKATMMYTARMLRIATPADGIDGAVCTLDRCCGLALPLQICTPRVARLPGPGVGHQKGQIIRKLGQSQEHLQERSALDGCAIHPCLSVPGLPDLRVV